MARAVLISLVWFVVIAVLAAGPAMYRHEFNEWFAGWLVIDAVSSVLLAGAIRLGAT
jgi:hypothetical protein